MARWRVGEGGVRVITARGTYSLPAGVVLDELPDQYEGKLIADQLDEIAPTSGYAVPKRLDGYADKMLRPAEDKSR